MSEAERQAGAASTGTDLDDLVAASDTGARNPAGAVGKALF
jgi:hypothetical protein